MEVQSHCDSCEELRNQLGLTEKDLSSPPKPRNAGLVLAACFGGSALAVSLICIPFVLPGFRRICLPYVPASTEQVQNVLKALRFCDKSGRLLDIGSGDGRIVLAAARDGFKSEGIEINSVLVLYSKYSALRSGLSKKVSFFKRDLWKYSLNPYKSIVIFGVEQMMEPLSAKFSNELSDGSRIIACRFPIPDWTPIHSIGHGIDAVWVYEVSRKNRSPSQEECS